uniref:RNA-directed DNA polymerase, eukaryota, reverse transcriptase zinc-binding domain protein n=1 Tax=Tanacetum cinerariifolium TaxID=118510 RepID=A0A699IW20_TANCI|nr:hypothetical protein [Tanacetum cinerariifolium]
MLKFNIYFKMFTGIFFRVIDSLQASEMRSEGDVVESRTSDMGGAPNSNDISNWVSNNASCSNGTGIIVGWDPNSIRVMVISQSAQGMMDFRDCLRVIGVEDLVLSGLRVMCNGPFVEKFVNSNAHFLPFVTSDHTHGVIEIPVMSRAKPRAFKFANFLADKKEFLPIVNEVRDKQVLGHAMFSVVSKLKLLRVTDLRYELERVQTLMVAGSFNAELRKKEIECLIAYKDALKDEESMLKQRANVDWLSEGDANTKFFHKTVKGNLNRNIIEYVEDMNEDKYSHRHVGAQFVKHL